VFAVARPADGCAEFDDPVGLDVALSKATTARATMSRLAWSSARSRNARLSAGRLSICIAPLTFSSTYSPRIS
jgi:hypothetical protein